MIDLRINNRIGTIALDDPARRNALSIAMFDALDKALAQLTKANDISVMILRGEGKAFCAGFDLAAAAENPRLIGDLIGRLSRTMRTIRRMPQVVIAAAHGAAIAGGCALLSACDFVIVSRATQLGYPVHRIGVSPAVTIPTLQQMIGPGAARTLLMNGELVDGEAAHRFGLATHLVERDEDVPSAAQSLAERIAGHGPHALRVTKAWLNELDGSLDDDLFDAPAEDSAMLGSGDEAAAMLRAYWSTKRS